MEQQLPLKGPSNSGKETDSSQITVDGEEPREEAKEATNVASQILTVVKPDKVVWALHSLREHKIHRTFAGYLCVRRVAANEGKTSDLTVDFKAFFDYFLAVEGGPRGKPYVYPIVEKKASRANIWYNDNVAGSYAPSSLREGTPFRKVIDVEGSGRDVKYSLKDAHWHLARKHLAYGKKIPVVPLAVFLYRNFALTTFPPTVADWVSVFKEEFGYLNKEGTMTEEFMDLYIDNSAEISGEGWFYNLKSS